jgi:hypothetical protein
VGIALKVSVIDEEAKIIEVVADSLSTDYECYIDYAYSNPSGYDIGVGHPMAKTTGPGEATLPAYEASVCMGRLESSTPGPNPGPSSDDLITLQFAEDPCDPCADGNYYVKVEEDLTRGGVVGSVLSTNLPITIEVQATEDCLTPETAIDPYVDDKTLNDNYYDEWVAAGKPECWCYVSQCYGDADGIIDGSPKAGGYYHVGTADLNLLMEAWDVKEPPYDTEYPNGISDVELNGIPGICANFDHFIDGSPKAGGYYHVGTGDLNRLMAEWNKVWPEPYGTDPTPEDCGGTLGEKYSDKPI